MELSTKILIEEAKKENIVVTILDEESNFIKLEKNSKVEYVKEATKTSKDNYVNVLMMENKYITNRILNEYNIKTPLGIKINNEYNLDKIHEKYNNKIVIKPVSTNFGKGITIFEKKCSKKELKSAIENGLKHDNNIIVENYVEGEEYRFLIINKKLIGILKRVPANVVGNNINTISELIDIKNEDEIRGENYEKPLQIIKKGKEEIEFLKEQNKTLNTILKDGEQIFLRKNSNISTGGDSIDYTDEIINYYKDIAIKAVDSMNVSICGVDMIIKDTKNENEYAILELNFNPAIHIHHFPFEGKRRNAAKEILNLIFAF